MLVALSVLMPPAFSLEIPGVAGEDADDPTPTGTSSHMMVGPEDALTGFTLVAPYARKGVDLVDDDGNVVHTWRSDRYTLGRPSCSRTAPS